MRRTDILVADDSEDLRELLMLVLHRPQEGWNVVATAAHGREAIEEAARTQPDVVLLDVAMPVMDGLQALPHILHAAPGTFVVMLSGYPGSTAEQDSLAAGAHAYLEKTDLVGTLVPQLQTMLEARPPRPRTGLEHDGPVATPTGARSRTR